MSLSFEWDEEKAAGNLAKHDVSFSEASTVFADPLSRTISDPLHSDDEGRFIIVGESSAGRTLVSGAYPSWRSHQNHQRAKGDAA
jgi:uncharacterized protein